MFVFGKRKFDDLAMRKQLEEYFMKNQNNNNKFILFYDVEYHRFINNNVLKMLNEITQKGFKIEIVIPKMKNQLVNPNKKQVNEVATTTSIHFCGREINIHRDEKTNEGVVDVEEEEVLKKFSIFYIGPKSRTLTNLLLNFNQQKVFPFSFFFFFFFTPFFFFWKQFLIFDTDSNLLDSMDANNAIISNLSIQESQPQQHSQQHQELRKVLMHRYFLIEKIRDAQLIGIVVGTLGVGKKKKIYLFQKYLFIHSFIHLNFSNYSIQYRFLFFYFFETKKANYLQILERIKKIIREADKKFYVFLIGKLNIAKLANFCDVDVFVLVSCPENSLVDSKEFLKPIVTPFELEIAFSSHPKYNSWNETYLTDYANLLKDQIEEHEKQKKQTINQSDNKVEGEDEGESEKEEEEEEEEEEEDITTTISMLTGKIRLSAKKPKKQQHKKKTGNVSKNEEELQLIPQQQSEKSLIEKKSGGGGLGIQLLNQ